MRRFIALLSLLVFVALLISCAQSVKQNGSINLDGRKIVSRAVQYSMEKSRAPEAGDDEEEITPEMEEALKAALDFKATLSMEIKSADNSYHDSAEEDYNVDYYSGTALEKKTITFTNVPVGIKATITAKITTKLTIKDQAALTKLFELMDMPAELADLADDVLIERLATELNWGYTLYGKSELTVHEGENPVTLKMTADPNGGGSGEEGDDGIAIGGTIEPNIPQTLTIKLNESASDTRVFLNKGTLAFKLLNEEDNEVTADPENPDLGNAIWTYKLSLKNTEIPDSVSSASGDVVYYEAEASEGKIEIKNLPAAGTYKLYVQAQPTTTGYTECAPTSALFDIVVEDSNYYEFAAGNVLDGSAVSADFSNLIASINTDAYIKIKGEVSVRYGDYNGNNGLFSTIKESLTGFQHLIDFDFSETTTTNSDKSTGTTVFQNCGQLRSIILPEDITKTEDSAFAGCSNLEKIVFGANFSTLSGTCVLASCPKLTSVIIPSATPLIYIGDDCFMSDSSLKTLSLPASFVALGSSALGSIENLILADESGTWYCTTNTATFESWWYNKTATPNPEDDDTLDSIIEDLSASGEISVSSPNSKKLLYAAQCTAYNFYCVK